MIVIEAHLSGHLWKLGCKSGVLDQWYSRDQFQPTLEKFIRVEDVTLETEVSLRTAPRQESICGGQGIFKCNCTGNCITKVANVTKLVLNVTVGVTTKGLVLIKNNL